MGFAGAIKQRGPFDGPLSKGFIRSVSMLVTLLMLSVFGASLLKEVPGRAHTACVLE